MLALLTQICAPPTCIIHNSLSNPTLLPNLFIHVAKPAIHLQMPQPIQLATEKPQKREIGERGKERGKKSSEGGKREGKEGGGNIQTKGTRTM